MQTLKNANLEKCLFEKCQFDQDEIEFLGYVIESDGISMAEDKVSMAEDKVNMVEDKVKHIQTFLGGDNFYRRFIANGENIVT